MLYPTSNCHEWTSDNGIEHRIMEIEFQHGCEVGENEDMRHLLYSSWLLEWDEGDNNTYPRPRPNCKVSIFLQLAPCMWTQSFLGISHTLEARDGLFS